MRSISLCQFRVKRKNAKCRCRFGIPSICSGHVPSPNIANPCSTRVLPPLREFFQALNIPQFILAASVLLAGFRIHAAARAYCNTGFAQEVIGMFRWSKPNRTAVTAFVKGEQNQDFSYPEVGCSRNQAPNGYTTDHNRIKLGVGVDVFERAKRAVRQWKMFDMPWINLCWLDTPIEPDAVVAILVSHLGFWSMNACRIVYVIDERGSPQRYGFAYGTLPNHAEIGEERFTVEFNTHDQTVWYDLYAVSRPTTLARLAYPFT